MLYSILFCHQSDYHYLCVQVKEISYDRKYKSHKSRSMRKECESQMAGRAVEGESDYGFQMVYQYFATRFIHSAVNSILARS